MAKDANPTNKPRKSYAAAKAKQMLKDGQARARKKMAEIRKMETPNALMNVGAGALGSIPVGAVCGLVPDSYNLDMAGKRYEIPTGVITESVVTGVSLLATIGMAIAGFIPGIHFAGGATGTGAAFLTARGVRWAREKAMAAWNNQNSGAGAPQAPAAAAGGGY